MKYYNRANTCDRCGENFGNVSGHPYREYDKERNWTGKWLCHKCYKKDYDKRPGCGHSLEKDVTDRRTGNQNPNSGSAKGDLFEELTCIWRGVKNLNIENDDYGSPIDHSRDPELGIIQTKGKLYDNRSGYWTFGDLKSEHKKDFDNLILYCMDKDMNIVERVYIVPKCEVIKRSGITIVKNSFRGPGWYEKYRVKDEGTLKIINDIWINIIIKRKRKQIIV